MKRSPRLWSTANLCFMALLMALSILLTRVLSLRLPAFGVAEGQRIGFGHVPLVMVSLFYGPFPGLVVGLASDLIGYFINPTAPFNLWYTALYGLMGGIPGLAFLFTSRQFTIGPLAVAAGACSLTNMIVKPLILRYSYGVPLMATVPTAVLGWTVQIPLTTALLYLILKTLQRHPTFETFIHRSGLLC